MKVLIKDAGPEWDGTAYAALECDADQVESADIGRISGDNKHSYILIKGHSLCGAMLKSIKTGKGFLLIDRYLRRDIGLKVNEEVEIESLKPVKADKVILGLPDDKIKNKDYLKLCRTYLKYQPLTKGQIKPIYLYNGQEVPIIIKGCSGTATILTNETEISLDLSVPTEGVSFKDIGGLNGEIEHIRERIELPLKHSETLLKFGISPPRGVLLFGPPGCGKTMIARALSNEIGANFFEISGADIFNPYYGESEKNLREIFKKAKEKAPSVICIDEIDALGSSRRSNLGEIGKRIVTTLLTEMDGIKEIKEVMVVATTNNPNALDPALRRPGRFDYEVRIGIPDKNGRKKILEINTQKISVENKEETLESVSRWTHGYTGADLALLCKEATYSALNRDLICETPQIHDLEICLNDFDKALSRVKPTGMREFLVKVPSNLKWEDLGGLDKIKGIIQEEVVKSIRDPNIFEKTGIRPVRGILLYGPPGTGKTLLAKIIASQASANFIPIRGPEILSKWLGESEHHIRQIFSKAREVNPCVIFFDEIDAITAHRGQNELIDKIVNQLLTEMDGVESSKGVYIIAATNRKELIDPAFLRPGRFDYHILIPLPDKTGRKEIFKIHMNDKPLSDDINIDKLVSLTDKFSGAHIEEVCRRAGINALREAEFNIEKTKINMKHLLNSIETVKDTMNDSNRNENTVEVA